MNSELSYRSSFGRWCACTASSTASGCSPNSSAIPANSASVGSCSPIHTKPSLPSHWSDARPARTVSSASRSPMLSVHRTPSR